MKAMNRFHIHCKKGEKECKYWIESNVYDVVEAHAYNMNNRDKREIKKIIFDHFEYIEEKWLELQERKGK